MFFLENCRSWFDRILRRGLWARDPRHALGLRGETAAEKHLKRQGYRILERRLRTRLGELDIVALDGQTVVFVEVKTRRGCAGFDHPADFVDVRRQQRITRAAVAYLQRHGLMQYAARFDIVAVIWPDEQRRPQIEHIKNAFEAAGHGEFFS